MRRRSAAIAPPVSRLALCFASLRSRRRARAASSAPEGLASAAFAVETAARHGAARWICAANAAQIEASGLRARLDEVCGGLLSLSLSLGDEA